MKVLNGHAHLCHFSKGKDVKREQLTISTLSINEQIIQVCQRVVLNQCRCKFKVQATSF